MVCDSKGRLSFGVSKMSTVETIIGWILFVVLMVAVPILSFMSINAIFGTSIPLSIASVAGFICLFVVATVFIGLFGDK